MRSVPRVTTRSLPSRMIDPTLLHFTMRYRERGTNLGLKGQRIFPSKLKKPADKRSQGEGEMNLQDPGRTASKGNKGTKQASVWATSLSLGVLLHLQSQWSNLTLLAHHSHLRDKADSSCYRVSRAQSKEAKKVRTETLKQGIEGREILWRGSWKIN